MKRKSENETVRNIGYREICLSLGGQGIFPINSKFHLSSDKDSTILEYRFIATSIPHVNLEDEMYYADTIIVTGHVVRTWNLGHSEYWVSSVKYSPFKKKVLSGP
jgi:hypothetical protein